MKSFSRLALFLLLPLAVACGAPQVESSGSITSKQVGDNTVGAVVLSTKVPSPDYDFDTSSIVVKVNAHNLVAELSGALVLRPGMVSAQSYVLMEGAVGQTIADVQTAFTAGSAHPMMSSIPADMLLRDEVDFLPTDRTVILRNMGEGNIASYQYIVLHFKAPQ